MTEYSPADGCIEILVFGIQQGLERKNINTRIAMILIDNSIELAMKTFLEINRRRFNISEEQLMKDTKNFENLLKKITKLTNERIPYEIWGNLELNHKLRNKLYHEGIGLSVELNKIEEYASIAIEIISNLFEVDLNELKDTVKSREKNKRFELLKSNFGTIQVVLLNLHTPLDKNSEVKPPFSNQKIADFLYSKKYIDKKIKDMVNEMREFKESTKSKKNITLEQINQMLKISNSVYKALNELQKKIDPDFAFYTL